MGACDSELIDSLSASTASRSNQLHVAHPECRCQFVESDHCWIAMSTFQAADVLLAEAGNLGELLLSQAFLLP